MFSFFIQTYLFFKEIHCLNSNQYVNDFQLYTFLEYTRKSIFTIQFYFPTKSVPKSESESESLMYCKYVLNIPFIRVCPCTLVDHSFNPRRQLSHRFAPLKYKNKFRKISTRKKVAMLETKGKPARSLNRALAVALIVSRSPTRPLCRLRIFPTQKKK